MDPIVGAPYGDERFAQLGQGHVARLIHALFCHQDAHGPTFGRFAEGVTAEGVVVKAPWRLLGQLDLGEQEAHGRLPSGELDPGRLANHAAPAVAPDEVLRSQRHAAGQLHVDAGFVLHQSRHLAFAKDRHLELVEPAGEDALYVLLRQRQPIRVPGGKAAEVEVGAGESGGLRHLPLRQEPIGDTTLVEHLDRARLQPASARADERLIGAPLDDGDVDAGQRQLAGQHQARRAGARHHYRMLGHAPPPDFEGSGYSRKLCITTGALPQAPWCAVC